jgi:hypothetical protein
MCEELEQRVRQANNILVLKQSTLRPLLELCRKELCISSSAEEKFVSTAIRAGGLAGVLVH